MDFRRIALLLFLSPFVANAQTVEVKKENAQIEGENTPGFQVVLSAPENEVRNSLIKYLKTLGKVKTSGDYIFMAAPAVGGRKQANVLYATTKETGTTSAAWIGAPATDGAGATRERDIEKLTYDFGVIFHRGKIQAQIDESLQALEAVEKQQLRLTNQHRDLHNRIERNKREKTELEKSLITNKLELENLTKTLESTTKARDSIAVATEQIRKVVEMHRERQRKVE